MPRPWETSGGDPHGFPQALNNTNVNSIVNFDIIGKRVADDDIDVSTRAAVGGVVATGGTVVAAVATGAGVSTGNAVGDGVLPTVGGRVRKIGATVGKEGD
jgi:hypothetical protein